MAEAGNRISDNHFISFTLKNQLFDCDRGTTNAEKPTISEMHIQI
jgi:hypothetical protein